MLEMKGVTALGGVEGAKKFCGGGCAALKCIDND